MNIGKFISVEDLNTGKRYRSVNEAKKYTGISRRYIMESLISGNPTKGNINHLFKMVSEMEEYKSKYPLLCDYYRDSITPIMGYYIRALNVDFLKNKREISLYANALFEAKKWSLSV